MPHIKPLLSYIHGILDEHLSINQQALCYAFLHSHLTYCQIILSNTITENKNRLKLFKRKQLGLLQTADTMSALLLFLTILTFYHIHTKLLLQGKVQLMQSVEYGYAPSSFNNIWVKTVNRQKYHYLSNNDLYNLPQIRLEQLKKIPLYSLPFEWNSLCDLMYQKKQSSLL
jgi:hypothetical protein